MKAIVKLFFRTLRIILGPVMLLMEAFRRPKGLVRSPALQSQVDQQCQNLTLYQYQTCPFCIKVRQEMRRLSLNIEKRDAQKEGQNRTDLTVGGGQAKVPCLQIDGTQWLYESDKIIEYLRGRFAGT